MLKLVLLTSIKRAELGMLVTAVVNLTGSCMLFAKYSLLNGVWPEEDIHVIDGSLTSTKGQLLNFTSQYLLI